MKIVEQSATLEYITPDAAQVIERAARTCYKSEDRITDTSAEKVVRMLLTKTPLPHESPIEHAYARFRIVFDRGISHELVRHRLISPSQESTRYCNYGHAGEITVIEPPQLEGVQRAYWRDAVSRCEQVYLNLIESGCKAQIARSVLPTCLKTEMVVTANLREWRHICKLRTAPAAHPQMQTLAKSILRQLHEACPVCFEDLMSRNC